MLEVVLCVVLALLGCSLAVGWLTVRRLAAVSETTRLAAALQMRLVELDRLLRDELARGREDNERQARASREELNVGLQAFSQRLAEQLALAATAQRSQLELVLTQLQNLTQSNEQRLLELREAVAHKLSHMQVDANAQAAAGRAEQGRSSKALSDAVVARLHEDALRQREHLDKVVTAMAALSAANEQRLERLRDTVDTRLLALQADNASKLEQMRATVDEKLHATLEKRLGESFKVVSDRLEMVHQGLGEMQNLAKGVGDLKKVLTNIKTRGTWGEVQLGNLLEQILVPEQYGVNVAVSPERNERVEYAIKLPGKEEGATSRPLWLPIDAKFPQEDYQRLVDAAERGDTESVAQCAAKLESQITLEAKKIREKYIQPPFTTDFAVLFLPTEGLFAEVLRRPGLCERIQREHRVILAGPTTLAATLSSLQMGFRTLAIEKRSSEVWQVLGAVKTEFGKFELAMGHVKKKLQEAVNSVSQTETRSRQLQRKLKSVEALPTAQAAELLGVAAVASAELEAHI